MRLKHFLFLVSIVTSIVLNAQNKYWKPSVTVQSDLNNSYEYLVKFDVVTIDNENLALLLGDKEDLVLSVPLSETTSEKFAIKRSNTLSKELKVKFPEIRSYLGSSVINPQKTIRLDVNSTGYHAMIIENGQRMFIDPVENGDSRVLIYNASDLKISSSKSIFTYKEPADVIKFRPEVLRDKKILPKRRLTNGTLRTYRLAALCTAQYSSVVGGGSPTKSKSISAISTTINRINEIYTRELGVELVLVANTDATIFLPGDPDLPPNNDDLIDVLSNRVNAAIGQNNYDLSHGFSTGAGGLAWYASVCDKDEFSGGVTGLSNPTGDAYDIDYVAHELGHQFSGDHSFNGFSSNCAGESDSDTKWEPGSGSTIMGYAGICSSDNLQENTDAYFHGGNLEIMNSYIQTGGGSSCGTSVNTGNNKPVVTVPESGKTIPKSTPFQLEGSAVDSDLDDVLTYCWEQIDGSGNSSAPNTIGNANPIFRSFSPTVSTVRYFPQLDDLLNGTSTKGNNLSDRARDLNFRLTVRDNQLGQGQVEFKDLLVKVAGNSGPFLVTSQTNIGETVFVDQQMTVEWEVANTNLAPVNCNEVDILLSTDGGLTFDVLLASNVVNDGSEEVTIPDNLTNNARVKVKASDNFFFSINQNDFTIDQSNNPTFSTSHTLLNNEVCVDETVKVDFTTTPFGGFNDQITLSYDLPNGLTLLNAPAMKAPSSTISFDVQSNGSLTSGEYILEITAKSGSVEMKEEIILDVVGSLSGVEVNVFSPQDNSEDVLTSFLFEWEDSPLYESYALKVSEVANLSNSVIDISTTNSEYFSTNQLEGNATYFFQVTGENTCNETAKSPVFSFMTEKKVCETFINNEGLSLANGDSVFVSTINVPVSDPLLDLSVYLKGTHEYTDDLKVSLEKIGADAGKVLLFQDVCSGGAGADFDLKLNDAFLNDVPCVPDDGGDYKPEENLSLFKDKSPLGEWSLVILDFFPEFDSGNLLEWSLEVCYEPSDLTGVTPDESSKVSAVFPNPTSGLIFISNAEKWTLFNALGVRVLIGEGDSADLTDLPKGVYVLKTGNKSLKVVKQ